MSEAPSPSPAGEPSRRSRSRRGAAEPYLRGDGRWMVLVELPSDGRRKRRAVYGSSPDEVRERRAALLRLVETNEQPADNKTSLYRYMRGWLDGRAPDAEPPSEDALSPKGWKEYDYQLEATIRDTIGRKPIGKITRGTVQGWIKELRAAGKGDRTVQLAHAIVRKALQDAWRLELIPSNPALLANVRKPRRNLPEPWDEAACRRFLTGMRKDRDFVLYLALAISGLRPSEALGLTWPTIDLEAGTMRAVAVVTEWKGERFLRDQTKTDAGMRMIPLPSALVDHLREHKVRQDARIAELGDRWRDNDLVFPTQNGGARREDVLSKQFVQKVRRLELPHIRLYDLRRLAITMVAVESGLVTAQKFAGHTNSATTDGYTYLLPSVSGPAIERIAKRVTEPLAVKLAVSDQTDKPKAPNSRTVRP